MNFLEKAINKIVGDPNDKELRRLRVIVDRINALETEIAELKNEDFPLRTERFREKFKLINEEDPEKRKEAENRIFDEIIAEALALAREAGRRTLNLRAYDVQLMGAITLHEGKIAEMKTGEGKTLSGMMAAYLRALPGRGVHIVTVNEYLATRDAAEMGQALSFLGLGIGAIKHEMAGPERQKQYAADVTYGTNNEYGFDYLRDNMAPRLEDCVQREYYFAVVDEVDSILIDEARTPLIISTTAEEATSQYISFSRNVQGLIRNDHYEIDEKHKAVTLTEAGIAEMEKRLGVSNIYTDKGFDTVHHLEQALRASALFQRDRDYVVQNGEIVIVDEFTGRLMPGRRYSDGLHQAIEAKEGVEIKRESKTLASITFQNYFRLYDTLAGMTGTAKTEEEEFAKIYGLAVTVIPTNRDMIRHDMPDAIFRSEQGKFRATVREIQKRHEHGQPVLVGTISVEKSEYLSELLKKEGIKHEVLNAKNHSREAEIIANAGLRGAVTIATNMAGRGTDIKIGGPNRTEKELEEVSACGGLHILGTERHESRRIDNQLRGRSGRQGEPGSSQFFVSLDDDLMRVFGGDRVQGLMTKLDFPEDEPLEHNILSKSIESSQKRVEGYNFDIRKRLFEFDSVVNKHRERIYGRRRQILEKGAGAEAVELIREEVETRFQNITAAGVDRDKVKESFATLGIEITDRVMESEDPILSIIELLNKKIEQKLEKATPEDRQNIMKYAVIRTIDRLWMNHIDTLSHLRDNVSLQAYGQRDPLLIYKKEAFELFNRLTGDIRAQVVGTLVNLEIRENQAPERTNRHIPSPKSPKIQTNKEEIEEGTDGDFSEVRERLNEELDASPIMQVPSSKQTVASMAPAKEKIGKEPITGTVVKRVSVDEPIPDITSDPKFKGIGRNDPCPCGSGKKFKKCCGQ